MFSTEEQVRNGISIDAQLSDLHEWVNRRGHIVVGEYIDLGMSARKPAMKRPVLRKLLEELDETKPDVIAFCKLDRWFRSVKEYYKVQEILDSKKVAWKAIQEDYETVTASGRFKVNIMLAVAENEADRTSERIKTVMKYKVDKGEAISGKIPLGFMIDGKRVVHNPETVDMARDFFRHYMEHGSMHLTAKHMYSTYGYSVDYHMVRRMLRNPLYKGEYRDNSNYCDPIISPEDFNEVQEMLAERSIRSNPTGRVYIFSGLLICDCCGRSMTALFRKRASGITDTYYRCNYAIQYHRCSHHKMIAEADLERWLLDNISLEIEKWKAEWEIGTVKKKKSSSIDKASIMKKLDRLKDLYIDDLITKEQYVADRQKYLAQITPQEIDNLQPDFDALRKKFSGDFRKLYKTLTNQQKQDFWRGVISSIHLTADNTPQVIFR